MSMTITVRRPLGEIGSHGLSVLRHARCAAALEVLAGTAEDAELLRLAEGAPAPLSRVSEAFVIVPAGEGRWAIVGHDEKGLMYGCQEAADQLAARGALSPIARAPFVKVRGLYDFLHNHDNDSPWFYSEQYWVDFFDEMAANRYNSFNLVFSHQTHYLAPMFAYFLEMPEFPNVAVLDADAERIRKNHAMLQFISRQAQRRGINFILGMWQMCAWKGNENDWRPVQRGNVQGLDANNLERYIYVGMKRLIAQFPAIRGMQIRANEESGISRARQTEFYKNSLFKAMHEADRPFIFDFRLWMAERETVEAALEMVPGTRWSCKYWGEFMGAPYQPAKISPGYSYSDFLRQPLPVDFIYQVWSLGSPRVLLWGDPEYVRRFVRSTTLGGGCGFELNLHLAQKGYGNEPGAWRIFKNPADEYYTHETERYWLFNRLFGRLGYDPDAGAEEWMVPMAARFGEAADRMMALYAAGSDIITFLVQYTLSDPNMYIWPEIDTGGLLEFYLQTPTSDRCVIATVPEYVDALLNGAPLGKFSPVESARRFADKARDTFARIAALSNLDDPSAELRATLTDFRALACLAMYHAEKIHAAIGLTLYERTGDLSPLVECRARLRKATQWWEQLVHATQDTYHSMMVTGPNDAGDWKRKLVMVYEDELRIEAMLENARAYGAPRLGLDFGHHFTQPDRKNIYRIPVNFDNSLERGYQLVSDQTAYDAQRGFGWTEHGALRVYKAPEYRINDTHMDPLRRDCFVRNQAERMKGWRNPLLEDGIGGNEPAVLRVDLPDGTYDVAVVICDQSPEARIHGPMTMRIGEREFAGLHVQPLEEQRLCARATARGGHIELSFEGDWYVSAVLVYDLAPTVHLVPQRVMAKGTASEALPTVRATVYAREALVQVALLCAADGARCEVEMAREADGMYSAQLPACMAQGGEYAVLAKDAAGREARSAAVAVTQVAAAGGITLRHEPLARVKAGADARVTISTSSARPLAKATLHYSYVNQFAPVESAEMTAVGGQYEAIIPGAWLDPQWCVLYYFELVDEAGEGVIWPDFRERTPYYVMEVEAQT